MKTLFRAAAIIAVLTVPLVVSLPDHARADNDNRASVHPAVGSWFGKAVQLTGGVTPGLALFMTPTIGADGTFLGNDSLALGAPPFGPHTTAHGSWAQSDHDSIVADYVFMLPGESLGGAAGTVVGARFVWLADVIGRDMMIGFVNIKIGTPLAPTWESLTPNGTPVLPAAATALVKAPAAFYTDPATAPAGTLVFKFNLARVEPTALPVRHHPKKQK